MKLKALPFIVLLLLSGCSNREETAPPQHSQIDTPSEVEQTPIELQPESEAIRSKVTEYFKSGSEPSIKDAHWLSPRHLLIAMMDRGGSYDGWAESACIMAGQQGLITTGTRIEVIDYQSMLNNKIKSLGMHYCKTDESPPQEIQFN